MNEFDFAECMDRIEQYGTRRVLFRPVSHSDAFPLWLATRNPEFNRLLLWDRPDTMGQLARRVERIVDERRLGRMAALSVVVRNTGEWLGLMRLMPLQTPAQLDGTVIESGLWLHPKFWGSNITVEALRAVYDAAFLEMENFDGHVAYTATANEPARRALVACGFSRFGDEYLAEHENGTVLPALGYTMMRTQWHVADTTQRVAELPEPTPEEIFRQRVLREA
jgi:RimJ/RimL family protein N-acetyltransferase